MTGTRSQLIFSGNVLLYIDRALYIYIIGAIRSEKLTTRISVRLKFRLNLLQSRDVDVKYSLERCN